MGEGSLRLETKQQANLLDDSGSNPDLRITLVRTSLERKTLKSIITTHHSYKPELGYEGRRIDWLIQDGNKIIGCIGIGSPVVPFPRPLTNYLDWYHFGMGDRLRTGYQWENLKKIANNWRFTLIQKKLDVESRVLSLLCKEAKKIWKQKYGDKLVLIFTYVGGEHTGTVYRASGWEMIGKTAGYLFKKQTKYSFKIKMPRRKATKPDTVERKLIFVKPLHRYWKRELNKGYTNLSRYQSKQIRPVSKGLQETFE